MGLSQPHLFFSPLVHSISDLLPFHFSPRSPLGSGLNFYHSSSTSVSLNTGKDFVLFSTGILE